MNRDEQKPAAPPAERCQPKKKYVPPAIESDEPFERQALACGRKAGNPSIACMQNPSS